MREPPKQEVRVRLKRPNLLLISVGWSITVIHEMLRLVTGGRPLPRCRASLSATERDCDPPPLLELRGNDIRALRIPLSEAERGEIQITVG